MTTSTLTDMDENSPPLLRKEVLQWTVAIP